MVAFCCAGIAQDKIITTSGDTVLCRILNISEGTITYEQKTNDGQTAGKFISTDRVSEYFREKGSFISLPSKPFRISIEGGYGYLLSSFSDVRDGLAYFATSENISQYLSGMKNGIHLSADFYLLLNEHFGVGAKYSLFASSAELALQYYYMGTFADGNTLVGINTYIPVYYATKRTERFYFNYIAPSLFFRQWLDKNRRFALNESLSLGCLFYRAEARNNASSIDPNGLKKSRQFAGNFDVSLEYYLLPYLSVSANAGVFYSKIKELETNCIDLNGKLQTQTSKRSESVSRFNLSAGMHFYF
jgi:hypothetical protein